MKNPIFIAILIIIISSCTLNNSSKESIIISEKSNSNIKEIILHNNLGKTKISIDSLYSISNIQNYVHKEADTSYLNTWITFNSDGGINQNESHYIETTIFWRGNKPFFGCRLNKHIDTNRYIIAYGDFDDNFNLNKNGFKEFIKFDSNGIALFQLKRFKEGENIIRLMIIKSDENDALKAEHITYVEDKKYLVK